MSNQAINVPACRRSTRIATAIVNQSSMSSTHIRLTGAGHSRGRSPDAGQPQPSLLKLLSHLKPDFTHADIHACEEAVLAAGDYVYLDVVLPYYQDTEARLLALLWASLMRHSFSWACPREKKRPRRNTIVALSN